MSPDHDRIVLDTNVCLDLFVFDDPRCVRLHEELHSGAVIAVTDDACRGEWVRVLGYPALALDADARAVAITRFDALMQVWPSLSPPPDAPKPPRCRDPDDQKFLDLAIRARARWLLSRDDHLLALARRAARDALFTIQTPDLWTP